MKKAGNVKCLAHCRENGGAELGYMDKSRETVLTLGPSYVGSHLVTVLSEVAPNGAALFLLDRVFYQINSVHSANVLGTAITYD